MARQLPYDRSERVADQMYHIIATACIIDLDDPRLKDLEITRVRMTKDLRLARVYFHLREKDGRRIGKAKKGLKSAKGFLKQKLREDLHIRYMPELEFFYDESIDMKEKIDVLMGREDYK